MPNPRYQTIRDFVDWLYDTCPVNPEQVSRQALYELWVAYRRGLVDTGHAPRPTTIAPFPTTRT